MTWKEANELKIGDKVDHRDEVGRFLLATIKGKEGTKLKIHYDGWDEKWDTCQDYNIQLHNFAKSRSISHRKAHVLKDLKLYDLIECSPLRHPGWKLAEIRRFDSRSGQIQVYCIYQLFFSSNTGILRLIILYHRFAMQILIKTDICCIGHMWIMSTRLLTLVLITDQNRE